MVFAVGDGVVLNFHCGHMTDELLILKLVEAETVTSLHLVVVMLDVGDNAFAHL